VVRPPARVRRRKGKLDNAALPGIQPLTDALFF